MVVYSEREIARTQIDAAIEHYEKGGFIPAITLAGAAEEILGKQLREAGEIIEAVDDLPAPLRELIDEDPNLLRELQNRFTPSLDSRTEGAVRIQQLLEESEMSDAELERARTWFVRRANRTRNALKHRTSESGDMIEIGDLAEEARDMLDRATSNYWQLVQEQTPAMGRYLASRLHRNRVAEADQ